MTSTLPRQHRGSLGLCPDGPPDQHHGSDLTRREPEAGAVLTVTGAHRPEVVAQVFAALAGRAGDGAVGELVDLAQSVLHGRLTLVAALRPGPGGRREQDALLARLVRMAAELSAATGMDMHVEAAEVPSSGGLEAGRTHVSIVGSPVPVGAVSGTVRGIEAADGWIESMSATNSDPLTGVELVACGARPDLLHSQLARVAAATRTDIAIA